MKTEPFFKLTIISALTFILSMVTHAATDKPAADKPNVVFILCDDLGYGDLGCYGQKKNKTPNIDALAKEGLLFTDHYSGSTVCAPSRSVLMTGQHTGHTPVRGNGARGRRPDGSDPRALEVGTYTIPKMFKAAGYQNGMFGKWGLGEIEDSGNALKQCFDTFYGYYNQSHAHTFYPLYIYDNDTKIKLDGNTYSHDLIWNQGLKFIRRNSKSKTPFFCYYSITVPHASMSAPEKLHQKWRKVYPEFDKVIGRYHGKDMGKDSEVINPIAGFAAMIENLDNQVGELIAELKKLNIDKNTLVIFTSDNGAHHEGGHDPEFWNSNGPFRGLKRNLTEGGIHTPMLMRWPGTIKPERRTSHISAFWDFLPTFADMAGQKVPAEAEIDGISMLPTMTGNDKDQKQHKVLYWAFNERGAKQAIRTGKWKLIRYRDNKSGKHDVQLYDLEKDIGEENNLAEKNPEVVSQCIKLMDAQHEESPYYPIEKAVVKPKKSAKKIKHKFLATDESGKQLLYVNQFNPAADWTIPLQGNRDISLISPTRFLVSVPGGYREYEVKTGKMIKEVIIPQMKDVKGRGGNSWSMVRRPDGTTYLGNKDAIYELNKSDKVVREIKTSAGGYFRLMRMTDDGHFLFTSGATKVKEIDTNGQLIKEFDLATVAPDAKKPYFAERMSNGHTLVSTGYGAALLDLDKEWKLVNTIGGRGKIPGVKNTFFFGQMQQLKNGNYMVAHWTGHKKEDSAKAPQVLELTKDGKVAWSWHNPARAGSIHGIAVIQ